MPRVLISVYDKTGVVEFARELVALNWEIISSGGTFKVLAEADIPVRAVEEITGFPEMMDGRVKTLHPKIHAGILADRNTPAHLSDASKYGVEMIDMVVVNLYPFSETVNKPDATEADAIHNIDIGGPAMLRAAAKNFYYVTAVIDPADYNRVLRELNDGGISNELRKELAIKVFIHTSRYDREIANYFAEHKYLTLDYTLISPLRYGENPHQAAALYRAREVGETSIVDAKVLHGKALSYNNIMDADAALNLVKEFSAPAVAVIKHTNPCGCAVADTINDAFHRAYEADSQSAFGGIIAMNRTCTKEIAVYINTVFAEVVITPDFDGEALAILMQKKNIRLLKIGELHFDNKQKTYRHIIGGLLEQDLDRKQVKGSDLTIVSDRQPEQAELNDLLFAWQVAKHVKSNAIVLVHNGVTVGIGAGQMSRVDAVEMAIQKAGPRVKGSVCASDAFFPFRDSVDILAQAGVTAVIQPGGSVKDEEVVAAVNELGMTMVFTGVRAFKH